MILNFTYILYKRVDKLHHHHTFHIFMKENQIYCDVPNFYLSPQRFLRKNDKISRILNNCRFIQRSDKVLAICQFNHATRDEDDRIE